MKRVALVTAGLALAVFALSGRAQAMPPFAKAYGINCDVCHTQVPTLNAYGRYVQRTGYASLDPHTLRRVAPMWIGEQANYDSTGSTTKPQLGNLSIHAVGAIGEYLTYHAQQWIWQDNASGDLDTLWLAYNNLLHRDGHLFVGKIEAPGPSSYSMWADISPFVTPEMTVGEHVYQLDGNRWGAKLNYVKGSLDVEAGWLYSSAGWVGSSDFGSDKTFQYKLAIARPTQPLEYGLLGARGSLPVSTGTDQYSAYGAYAQRDPTRGLPGAFVLYMRGSDTNPGADPNSGLQLAPANGSGLTTELYQPFFNARMLVSARKEWSSDGLGNATQSGVVDLSYMLAKYLRVYTEVGMGQGMTPAWRYYIWWTTPIQARP